VQPRGWCSMRVWVCWRGGSPGASGSNCEAAARVVQQALLGLLVGRQPALHTAELAAAPDAAGRKREALSASGMFSPPSKAVQSRANRPALNVEAIIKDVNTLYIWQWRTLDGTYEDFDTEQCIGIETEWRQQAKLARVRGMRFPVGESEMLKCLIDFDDMTTSIVGCVWATAVRRWDRDVPMGDTLGPPG